MTDVLCSRTSGPLTLPVYQIIPSYVLKRSKEENKKVYYCQRCLNHDRAEPRKNHKCECPYANCTCFKCSLVEKRRKLNLQLHELEGDVEKKDEEDEERKLKGERVPNCQKCGQHGRKSRLKGHKRVCPFRDCKCAKCSVVTERQKLMADQIKIRRRQRKDTLMNLTRDHITSTLNAAAALSAAPFNFNNLNALLYGSIKTSPQPLLSSPTSSDASSYSPSLQFPSPSLPLLIPSTSPDTSSPTTTNAQTPSTNNSTTTSTPIVAPVAINPTNFPFGALTSSSTDTALLQTLLAQYKLLEEVATFGSHASSPVKEEDGEEETTGDDAQINSNCIIDVCSV